ncbi:zinc dependent phospholipase C family protein [Chloroflexota bacterium]
MTGWSVQPRHRVAGGWSNAEDYGTFLFGCLAPDVDKLCRGLEQGVTHFLPKDEGGIYAWQRSQHFPDHPGDALRAPFGELHPGEQAFVLGYLCHVAADEISGRLAPVVRETLVSLGTALPHVDAVLTAMDPRFWALATDPEGVVGALSVARIPNDTFIFAPSVCLAAMQQIVLPQVREGGGLLPYLSMMRRQWQWTRHGQVSDETDDDALEAELAIYRRQIEADLPASVRLVETMELESIVEEAVDHSHQRIRALLNGDCRE